MPSSIPSSVPSQEAKVWIVQVNSMTELSGSGTLEDCYPLHWLTFAKEPSSERCSIHNALLFCIHRVPWLLMNVKECRILLMPQRGKYSFEKAEPLPLPTLLYSNGSDTLSFRDHLQLPHILITIDGRNSWIDMQLSGNSFLTSVNEFVVLGDPYHPMLLSSGFTTGNNSLNRRYKVPLKVALVNIGISNCLVINGAKQTTTSNTETVYGSDSGSCIHITNLAEFYMSNVSILNCKGDGLFGSSIYVRNVDSVFFTLLRVITSEAKNGGALAIIDSGDVVIYQSTFYDNYGRFIGGAVVVDGANFLNISFSQFSSNVAGNFGGALSINRIVVEGHITRNKFVSNSAKFGSSIVISKSSKTIVRYNVFEANDASQAGTIYWLKASGMNEPFGISTNSFISNKVSFYGDPIATEPVEIVTNPPILHINNYEDPSKFVHASASVIDYYKTVVSSENDVLVEAHIASDSKKYCGDNTLKAKLFGTTTEVTIQGAAVFKHLSAFCAPGGYVNVTLTSTMTSNNVRGFPAYKGTSTSSSGGVTGNVAVVAGKKQVVQSDVKFQFRECHRGEIYVSDDSLGISICQLCNGGYSLLENRDNTIRNCNPCPKGASACYGTSIILKVDAFRWNEDAATVFSCPLANACKGGNGTGDSLCNKGYTGIRCGICEAGYFRSSLTNGCAPCKGTMSYVLLAAIVVLLVVAIILFYIQRYKEQLEDYFNKLLKLVWRNKGNENIVHLTPDQT